MLWYGYEGGSHQKAYVLGIWSPPNGPIIGVLATQGGESDFAGESRLLGVDT